MVTIKDNEFIETTYIYTKDYYRFKDNIEEVAQHWYNKIEDINKIISKSSLDRDMFRSELKLIEHYKEQINKLYLDLDILTINSIPKIKMEIKNKE